MPKKPVRNSYYYFMLDFKEQQRKKGINYANMREVQEAADPAWRVMTTAQKAKYEEIAKREKVKNNVPEKKYTSQGIPFSEIERQQRAVQEAEEAELKAIKNFVKLKGFNKMILDEEIYIMDVNAYCYANNHFLIGEATVLKFSLTEGIIHHYHIPVNPGSIPIGYASDVKIGAEELGLDMPDRDNEVTDFIVQLSNIIDFMRQSSPDSEVLPPLYTMPEKVQQVQDFIIQLCSRAGEDDSIFRIYKLDTLFFYLINEVKTHQNEGFPKMSLATAQLKKDPFRYAPGLCCDFHKQGSKPVECTLSRVKRWAYTIMDSTCPVTGIEPVPENHLPPDVDVETVLLTKEAKKEALGVTSQRMTVSLNESFASVSLEQEEPKPVEKAKDIPKRQHVPLRKPKTDYTSKIRPPPEITEDHDYPLMSGAGRGRGRGSASSSYSSILGSK